MKTIPEDIIQIVGTNDIQMIAQISNFNFACATTPSVSNFISYRILAARYGEVAGRLTVGGRGGSVWWREMSRIRDGEGVVGGTWFADGIDRRVGDGADTLFWSDPWLGGIPLCVRYRRLFDLATKQSISVAEMCALGWEEGGVAVAPSFVGVGGGGVACGVDAYYRRTTLADGTTTGASDLIWHKQVPLKLSVLAWWLLHNRLPTKDNLVACNIIPPDASLCVGGCGESKTANHLFLSCPAFAPLWLLVCFWLHIDAVASEVLPVHFTRFVACLGGSRTRRSFLQLVWLCCMSVIWHQRNNRFFKAEGTTMQQMLEKFKLCTYWWMKAHNVHLGDGRAR
ncbi:hypothetical protein TSUD_02210 [Trifolium subterraneum]|nr:hypothetical protein TSUD_02210 [Trifolium subterraneum]